MHTPDDPTPTAKRRQTCTHPGTISATQTCNAATHGPWTHLMIANQRAFFFSFFFFCFFFFFFFFSAGEQFL